MPEIEIVCLANSLKHGGRCVAGLRTDGGGWVRPVSTLADGTLVQNDYTLTNGDEAALFDVIGMTVTKQCPQPHQPENWVLAQRRWELVRRLTSSEASQLLAPAIIAGPELLGNRSDRISWTHLQRNPAEASLAIVEPVEIRWQVTTSYRGAKQIRALFELADCSYSLAVTDPRWIGRFDDLKAGVYLGNSVGVTANKRTLLTISVGEPLQEETCFKLVAGVLLLSRRDSRR